MKTNNHQKTTLILISLLFLTISFSFGIEYYRDYKFEQSLKEAAKIPASHWDEQYKNMPIKDKYKVVIITNKGGEYSYAEFFKFAAEKRGWEVLIYEENIFGYEKEILEFDPDFILQTLHTTHKNTCLGTKITNHRSKKYLMILLSLQSLRYHTDMLKSKTAYELNYALTDHIISNHAVLTSAKEVSFFKTIFEKENKIFNGIRILPLAPSIKNTPNEPKSLFWGGAGWDKFRSSENYKNFIKLLGENLPMKIYGSYRDFSYLPKVYDGNIPPGMDNIEAIRKNGIYLLTHTDVHIESGTPSLRIFEALAANAVVISDMHPFAIEHFGDNFLYFDQTADAETMYKQVKTHYDWIKTNPEKAKAMAARAHQIFLEKFSLDKDLDRIAKMHEFIEKQEKDMGLSYPLAY